MASVVLRKSNTTPLGATNKRSRFSRVPITHAQFTCKHILPLFAYDCCVRGAYQILKCQSDVWWLMTVFLPTCTCPYLPWLAIIEAGLPFMTCRICVLRTLLSGSSFQFVIYVICGAIAVIASMTYMITMLHSLTHSDMLDSNRCSWSLSHSSCAARCFANYKLYNKVYITLKQFCYLKLATH